MKQLSSYILEKLKIDKNVQSRDFFKKDDGISCLDFYLNNPWDKTIQLRIYQPFKIKSIDDDKLIYKVPFHDRDVEFEDYYINSHGHYQSDSKETGGKTAGRIYSNTIILKPADYKKLLELFIKEKVFNPKYKDAAQEKIINLLTKEYFDNINMKEVEGRELIYYDNTHSGGVWPFERPKELKEVIDNYYAEY